MVKYIIKRILYLIPILLGVSAIIFILKTLTPGDPARTILGNDATEEQVAIKRAELGLTDPAIVQYFRYIANIVYPTDRQVTVEKDADGNAVYDENGNVKVASVKYVYYPNGNFGTSYRTGEAVLTEILPRLKTSAIITLGSVAIGAILGVILGIISALKKYTFIDSAVLVLSMFFQSVPEFVVGLVLILIFAVNLNILPSGGIDTPLGYILPMLCVGLQSISSYTRITRTSMLEVLSEDYIRTAHAKGQTPSKVVSRHALRNAMIPVAQSIGTSLGNCIGGGMVIETVFGVPGVGKYIVDAISARNYPSVLGGAMIIAMVLVVINLLVDISFILIDPRLKTTIISGGKKKPKKAKAA